MTTSRRLPRDAGVSIAEVLVTVVVLGILAAIAYPVVRAEQHQSLDNVVVADIERYATAAERAYSTNLRYPTTPDGFNLADTRTPAQGGAGNAYRAFVVPSGAKAGWVIYGRSNTTGRLFMLTSYNDGEPKLMGTGSIPLFPPMGGAHGVPAEIRPADWASTSGTYWGDATVWVPTEAAYPVMPFPDNTYANTTKPTLSSANLPQVLRYYNAPFRVVDIVSPVAERAVEVVTDSAVDPQGVILHRAPAAATWPAEQVPVAGTNERWTVSAFVKAPSGASMTIGCRYMKPDGTFVGSAVTTFTGAGSWQRPSFACPATTAGQVGSYVDVQVNTNVLLPGTTFYVTGPQVNKSTSVTAFKPQ